MRTGIDTGMHLPSPLPRNDMMIFAGSLMLLVSDLVSACKCLHDRLLQV